jgi:aspartate-semialdehyde dehydrogenase
VVPWLGSQVEGGYSDEEMKLRNESRKILDIPGLNVAPTCVRVPVMVGPRHRGARDLRAPGRPRRGDAGARAPSPTSSSTTSPRRWSGPGATRSPVGRVRADLYDDHSLNFFVVGDNLLKGAALNTVQIAELLHARGLVPAAA